MFTQNVAVPNIGIVMTDETTHAPVVGKTVTVTRRIDAGSHAAIADPTVTEVGDGEYRFDMAAADMNGVIIMIKATATDCDTVWLEIKTTV